MEKKLKKSAPAIAFATHGGIQTLILAQILYILVLAIQSLPISSWPPNGSHLSALDAVWMTNILAFSLRRQFQDQKIASHNPFRYWGTKLSQYWFRFGAIGTFQSWIPLHLSKSDGWVLQKTSSRFDEILDCSYFHMALWIDIWRLVWVANLTQSGLALLSSVSAHHPPCEVS